MVALKGTVPVAVWSDVKNLLEEFRIQLAQTEHKSLLNTRLPLFGVGPGDAQALTFPKEKGHKMDAIILFPHYKEETPTLSIVLDILHEAAHLVLNDEDTHEDKGVAQAELALGFLISPLLFEGLIYLQNEFYVWDVGYETLIQRRDWRTGHLKARKVINKTKTYPWKTVSQQRKAILGVLEESKKARPRA